MTADLVPLALAGDKQALGQILEALQDPLYDLALRMLGHPDDASDAVQEILVIVITHLFFVSRRVFTSNLDLAHCHQPPGSRSKGKTRDHELQLARRAPHHGPGRGR